MAFYPLNVLFKGVFFVIMWVLTMMNKVIGYVATAS